MIHMLRKLEKDNTGMTTVEACVIIPITLAVIMLLIWLGFFFYNKNILSQAAGRAAIMAGQHPELDNDELVEYIDYKLREMIEGKTVFIDNPDVEITVEYSEIVIHITSSISLPESVRLGGIYMKRIWEIDLTEKAARLHPSIFVRTIGRARKGLIHEGDMINESIGD